MTPALSIALTLALLGQNPQAEDSKEERAARLELMKASMAKYDVHSADEPRATYRPQADPVIRFTNPVGATKDGVIFLWIGEDGRPEAAIQSFLMRTGLWGQEFTTLSRAPLVAEKRSGFSWRPRRGLEFKPVPGAPKPADSGDQRLRQMKEMVEGFEVSDDFRQKGWQALRPMPKPFARYGKPGTATVDGGMFCFALGTDPEAFLLLEANEGKDGAGWHYAFAPQSMYALKASWKGKEAWSIPVREAAGPGDAFLNLVFRNLE